MNSDECLKVSNKSWLRAVDSIHKDGYKEGAADGQAASFQSSFDIGYKQGLNFGWNLGYKIALTRNNNQHLILPTDPRSINCQLCMNNTDIQDNLVNIYNKQQEKNENFP